MIAPALAIVGFQLARAPMVPVPLPLFVLWPLLIAALLLVTATRISKGRAPEWCQELGVGLALLRALSGLRIELGTTKRRLLIWII